MYFRKTNEIERNTPSMEKEKQENFEMDFALADTELWIIKKGNNPFLMNSKGKRNIFIFV